MVNGQGARTGGHQRLRAADGAAYRGEFAGRYGLPAHHETMVLWAMITIMTRRLARPG